MIIMRLRDYTSQKYIVGVVPSKRLESQINADGPVEVRSDRVFGCDWLKNNTNQ